MSLFLTLNKILTFFSSISNVVCEHVFFRLNMTTIMVATITIYVDTTVIMTMTMTMTGTTTMIMIMVVTKTMIMTMIATTTMTKIFQVSSTRQFLSLAQNDKKGCKSSICTSSLKNRCFFHYSTY